MARQISPRPCVAMKLMASGVTMFRRHRQIALVLAVFIVDHYDHAPGSELVEWQSRYSQTANWSHRAMKSRAPRAISR